MFKRITQDSYSPFSSPSNSQSSSNDDFTNHEDSLDSLSSLSELTIETGDWEDSGYKSLIEDFPIGLWVWKLEEDKSPVTLRLVFANTTSEILSKKKKEDIIGKTIDDIVPGIRDSGLIEKYIQVIKTSKEQEIEEINSNKEAIGVSEVVYRVKAIPLTSSSCGLLFEDITELRAAEQKNKENRARVEIILEKAIDLMTSEINTNSDEFSWMSIAMRNLLSFFDESQGKVLVQEKVNTRTQITMADVMTLINNLNEHSDDTYLNQFLISFRYFIAPSLLLKKLVLRFVSANSRKQEEKERIQERTIAVIKSWIKTHYYDFESDPELLGTLQNFVTNTVAPESAEMANLLKKAITKHSQPDRKLSDSTASIPAVFPIPPKRTDLLTIDPHILANQMTLISFDMFKQIKPAELYFQAWSKNDKLLSAPNVTSLIANFNKLSSWISSEIVFCPIMKKRAQILRHFISVAWAAYGYRDFETLFTIQIALSMHSISRLCDTWRLLDSKTRQQWQRINSFCSFEGNYKTYRGYMKKIFVSSKTPNVLPYVGMYLRDLTALEEGSGSFDKGGAVNFHKMRMVANIIAEIQHAQRSLFNFQRNLDVISALSCGLFAFDEERLHELSKRCEPSSEPLPENFFENHRHSERFNFSGLKMEELELVVTNPIYGMKIPTKKRKEIPQLRMTVSVKSKMNLLVTH